MEQIKHLKQEVIIQELKINSSLMTLGRSSDNNVEIKDKSISAHHAKIVTYFNTSYIEDLNSTNGTLLNGKPVHKHIINHGDEITIGSHLFIISKNPPDYLNKE